MAVKDDIVRLSVEIKTKYDELDKAKESAEDFKKKWLEMGKSVEDLDKDAVWKELNNKIESIGKTMEDSADRGQKAFKNSTKELTKITDEMSKYLGEEINKKGRNYESVVKDKFYQDLKAQADDLRNAKETLVNTFNIAKIEVSQNNKKSFDIIKDDVDLLFGRFANGSATLRDLNKLARQYHAIMSDTKNPETYRHYQELLAKIDLKREDEKKEMAAIKNEMKLDGSIFKDAKKIGKLSLDELGVAAEALNFKLSRLDPTTEEFIETSKRLSLVNNRMNEVKASTQEVQKSLLDAKQILNNAAGYLAAEGVSEGLQVIFNTLDEGIDEVREYGKALSALEAITGATGNDLADLEKRAENLTEIVLDGDTKITNSAASILKAFKLVGSAKPELLSNAEALEDMTKKAIVFQKASGLELPEAVKYLTSTMAQFNATAKDSDRYINAIAAGAKEGATEIPDVASAIEEFGAGAASANFSIEESVALVETLGDKMIKGNEAGTALRNILIAIKAPDALSKEGQAALKAYNADMNLLKDTSKTGGERLKELSKIVNDASAMVTVFGKENVTAAEILLRNVDRYDQLTKAITGTNEAYRQGSAMSNNLDNDLDNLKDTSTQLFSEFARTGVPIVRVLIQGFVSFLKGIKDNWDAIIGYTKTIATAVATVSAYYATVKIIPPLLELWAKRQIIITAVTTAWGYATDVLTGKIKIATLVQQAWNVAARANPIGIIVSVLTAAVGIWSMYSNKVSEAVQAQKQINDLNATAQKNIAGQKVEMEQLLIVARDEKRSKDERIAAVKKLNELSPEYLGNLTLEKINTNEATKAVNNYVLSLEKRAKSEAAFQKRTELEKELIDLKGGQIDLTPSFGQQTLNFIKAGGNAIQMASKNALSYAENYNSKLSETQKRIESLNKYITANQIIDPTAPKHTPPVPTNKFIKNGADKEKKEVELLAGTVAYLREQLSKLNKEFDNAPETKTAELAEKLATETKALADAEDKLEQIRNKAIRKNTSTFNGEVTKALTTLTAPLQPTKELDKERQLAQAIADMKIQTEKERLQKQKAAEEKHQKEVQELKKGGLQAAQIASDAIFQIQAQNSENRKNEELKRVEQTYKSRLDKAKGNQKEQDKINKEMDAQKLKIEKEAFERDKKRSILQAIINGAMAITKILAEYPKFDFGVMTAIGIGLAAVTTAAQVATISNQKFAKGGIVKGASHTEGGIKLFDTKSKSIVGEMEGDEPYLILSKNTYRNNKDIVDALIDSSMNRNGAAVMAKGGILQPNATATAPIQTIYTNNTSSYSDNKFVTDLGQLLGELKGLREAFEKFPREFKGYIKWQDLQEAQDLVNTIKNKAFGT